jgi:hypothetical protein
MPKIDAPVIIPSDRQLTAESSLYQELRLIGLSHFDAEYGADLLASCKLQGDRPSTRYETNLLKKIKRLHEQHKRQPDYRQVAA